MKHVIVIETPDEGFDGRPIPISTQNALEEAVEFVLFDLHGPSYFVRGFYNRPSAIAAVHEMYGAPEWKPNEN